jgi:predicted HAD superfamily Cof-like phosphohydrolase
LNIKNKNPMSYISKVYDFHNTFNVPVLDKPEIPSEDRCQLRVNLLQEELNELSEAIKNKDLVEIADALCDLQYVLSGSILEFGLQNKFEELFDEVQRSNMSKACETMQEAIETISHYKKTQGYESVYKKVGDKFVVYRLSDNKVLKSVKYSPTDLKKIIENESQKV